MIKEYGPRSFQALFDKMMFCILSTEMTFFLFIHILLRIMIKEYGPRPFQALSDKMMFCISPFESDYCSLH